MKVQYCVTHNIEAVLKEGVSKKTNKPYSFYACPERINGEYCNGPVIDKEITNPNTTGEWEGSLNAPKDIRSGRIERQHSQHMALLFVDMLIKTDKLAGIDKKLSDLVREYTDWFQKDLDISAQPAEV